MTPPERPSRLYRLMLRALPRTLREEFGDDMARLFLDRQREARDSRLDRAGVWTRAVLDLLSHAFAERWRPEHRRLGAPAPRRDAPLMELWLADARHALRTLRRGPAFATATIATLALGIGANVAIFTAVNTVLLRPLPLPEPDRLVRVWPQFNFNKASIARVADSAPALEQISGVSGWLFTLTGEGDPQQISGALVSWDHFDLLGIQPALGRSFTADEGVTGQGDAVILSHGLWVNVFGADPDIIGRRIRLAAGEYQTRRVVGVMPRDFRPIDAGFRLWAPLDVDATLSVREDSSWYVNILIGRLAEGASAEQATAQVRSLASSLHTEWPERFEEEDARAATVVSLQEHMVRNLSGVLWMLLAAVGGILLIACVNVANLLLARGSSRERDLAMRAALGANRARLVSQLLTESLILGAGGCLVGLLVAWSGLRLLAQSVPEEYYQVAEARFEPVVMTFALGISLGAVLLFGLLPAWRTSSAGQYPGLAGWARGVARGGGRLSQGLVVVEVALSVVLVICAGLMLRSLWNLYTDDLGFDPGGVLTFRISIPEGRFEEEALPGHYRGIWDAINAVPGVEQAGGIHLLPLTGSNWNFPYVAEDHPVPEGTPPPNANHRVVTPTYFDTLRIPVVLGRGFTERDTAASPPVGMINRRMARELWPDDDPLRKTITVFGTPFTVIGVVGDIHQHGMRQETEPEMYRPYDQWATGGMFAVIRTSGDPAALAPSVQRAIWSVDPYVPIAQLRAMDEVFGQSIAVDRFVSLLIAAFGALALTLGAIGVYGVTAYAMGQRMREFGVRMAIGADQSRVLWQATVDGIKPALLGVAVGLAGSWAVTWLLTSLLYEVNAYDAATFVIVPAVLIAVATAACAVPAWRVSRLDPVIVLRQE